MANIENAFASFAAGGPEMDGRQFVKLCKDCKLIDSKFSSTDADLVFAKVKSKASRKITYAEFEKALGCVAERKKIPFDELKIKVGGTSGPIMNGTKPDDVRFHDDKSTYTGVHQNGGPSTIDKGNAVSDISEICDRSSMDVRGVKK
eukprot:TRINITY_DN190901_c0_g1_i1.p1 TRINITY_DN190901_c0_g1~~TRINITY_DN190901_c0_g1_i1.p1  ORF type:complete len:147 (+),score=27.62 TRINITY_DN190901_c0_g1_i1:58-498(+)